jgi:ribosome biogenesis GTPase
VSALTELGWGPRWEALLADVEGVDGVGRVVRHDGAGLLLATGDGVERAMFATRLDPEPTVGDWVATVGGAPACVLPRTSLLRRRAAIGDDEQVLAANVDRVLLVCGLDRPVRGGRLQRAATLAWDAGAEPVVVLTKAQRPGAAPVDAARAIVEEATPGLDVVVTSVKEGVGLDELRDVARDRTVVLLGESGAGKSSIVNALLGAHAAATGDVRAGDAKGKHTTTARELHALPGGGVLIDTPGIRSVGLFVDPEAVDATFADVDELADACRFADCRHDGVPGCAVQAAVEAGDVDAARVEAWRRLRAEAEAAALRAAPHELRKQGKRFARITKDAQRRKGRS